MKYLLIPLALFAGQAMACPADGSKDAKATQSSKPAYAATSTSTLTSSLATAPAPKAAKEVHADAAKTDGKHAAKSTPEARKPL